MPELRLSRNAQVLRYLLEAAPGVGHTKLVKFAYLADLEARRYLGRPISGFHYSFAQHGPFDRAFFAARDELRTSGYITEHPVACGPYAGPTTKPLEYGFSLGEAAVLTYVAETYLGQTAGDLCDDVVYQTEPMQMATRGKALKMDKVKREGSVKFGFKTGAHDLRRGSG